MDDVIVMSFCIIVKKIGNLFFLIALSLSGYSSLTASWQETCSGIMPQITSPYLRVLFGFLCACDNYNSVLVRD